MCIYAHSHNGDSYHCILPLKTEHERIPTALHSVIFVRHSIYPVVTSESVFVFVCGVVYFFFRPIFRFPIHSLRQTSLSFYSRRSNLYNIFVCALCLSSYLCCVIQNFGACCLFSCKAHSKFAVRNSRFRKVDYIVSLWNPKCARFCTVVAIVSEALKKWLIIRTLWIKDI